MSVAIGNQGSQYYVELKHGGKTLQIPCENEKQAKQMIKEAEKVEAKMTEQEKKLGQTPEQYMASLEQAPPPPKGVGEKLDVKAA